jgi:hypothetical protein
VPSNCFDSKGFNEESTVIIQILSVLSELIEKITIEFND